MLVPIRQCADAFFNTFEIENGVFYVGAYEGLAHYIDRLASPVGAQLPFLEIICESIIECINTENMCEKWFFSNWV